MTPTPQDYIDRIKRVAIMNPARVELTTRKGSGKTRELWLKLGEFKQCVVRMHVRLHRTFNEIVKAAHTWLDLIRVMFNVHVESVASPVALLPATVEKSTAAMLAIGAAKVAGEPAKVSAQRKPNGGPAKSWEPYYHPETSIIGTSLERVTKEAGL